MLYVYVRSALDFPGSVTTAARGSCANACFDLSWSLLRPSERCANAQTDRWPLRGSLFFRANRGNRANSGFALRQRPILIPH